MSMIGDGPHKLSAFDKTTDFTTEMRSTSQIGKRDLKKRVTVSHEGEIGITNISLNDNAAEHLNSTKATTFY